MHVGSCNLVRRAVRGVVLAMLVLVAEAGAADGRITAVFSIDSDYLALAVPAATLAEVEKAVAASLADTARSHFGFLDWQAADDGGGGPRLILRMTDLDGGACSTPPSIELVWSAVLESDERALANVLPHRLYQTCDPDIPTQEPERLVSDVVAAASAMLANDAMRRRVVNQVLARVPIASQLVNYQNAMVLLPVHPMRLSADPDSELVARFQFESQSADLFPGDIVIRPRSEFNDAVQLLVVAINVPSRPAPLPERGAVWHDVLAEVIANSRDLRVYMVNYVPSPFAGETVGDSGVLSEL